MSDKEMLELYLLTLIMNGNVPFTRQIHGWGRQHITETKD